MEANVVMSGVLGDEQNDGKMNLSLTAMTKRWSVTWSRAIYVTG